jgi:pimeloyl-ACP methyl ester carboxylesterase
MSNFRPPLTLSEFAELKALAAVVERASFTQAADHLGLSLQLYIEPWIGATGQAAFYRQIAQMDQRYTDELESRYGEIHCTVRILWGEEDSWIPVARDVS